MKRTQSVWRDVYNPTKRPRAAVRRLSLCAHDETREAPGLRKSRRGTSWPRCSRQEPVSGMLRTSAWATDGRCCRRRLLSLSSLEQTVFWQKVEQILGNERRLYSGSDDNPGELANELPKPGLVAMEAWWRSSPFQLSRRCRNRDSLLHACEFDAHHGQDLRRYCSRAVLCTGRKRSRHHGNTPEFSKNTFYP